MYVWINPSNTADSHLFPSMTQTFKLARFAYAVFSEAIAKTHKQLRSTASINSLCQCFILYFNLVYPLASNVTVQHIITLLLLFLGGYVYSHPVYAHPVVKCPNNVI